MNSNYYNLQMFGSHRPQFKNFPLSSQDIRELNQNRELLNKEISTNQRQIQELMTKSAQNNFQIQLLKKLKQKSMILNEKMRENEQMLRLQANMENEMRYKKAQNLQARKELGEQYKNAINQKKMKENKQREQERMMQKDLQRKNQQVQEEVERRKKLKQDERKKQYLNSIQMMEYIKRQSKRQNQQNKRESNQANDCLVRNDQQFQKHYKQYKQTFFGISPSSPPKNTIYTNGLLTNTIDASTMQNHVNNLERYKRNNINKLELQDSLKQQMQWNQQKKQRQREQHIMQKKMTDAFVRNNSELQRFQKQKKRLLQKQYQEDLNTQVKIKEYVNNRDNLPISGKNQNRMKMSGDKQQQKWSNMAMIGTNSLH